MNCMRWLTNFYDFGSNEQLQQQLEYTLLKPGFHSWGISDTLEEWYVIKFCFKLEKNDATETYGMLQTAFISSCMNRESVFEWQKTFKEGRESVRMMRGVAGVRKSIHQSWLDKGLGLGLLCWGLRELRKSFLWKKPALFKSGQWHFLQDITAVHNTILDKDYLTKMGIKTLPHPSYSPNL